MKSPSLSDEHFISNLDETSKNASLSELHVNKNNVSKLLNSSCPTNTAGNVDRQETGNSAGSTTMNSRLRSRINNKNDNDYEDDDDDDPFSRSGTLKPNPAYNNSSNSHISSLHNRNLLSDSEISDKLINRFNSDKSVFYSSVSLIRI